MSLNIDVKAAGCLDATVTLDNNRKYKHVVPVVNFLKCVVTEVVLFPIVAFETLTFHKVATHLRCGGILVTVLLQISLKIGQYLMKLRRMKLRRTKKCASFFGPPCTCRCRLVGLMPSLVRGWIALQFPSILC